MARIRKQTNSPITKETIWKIAFYIRLSKEDGNDESLSITNQRKLLTEHMNGKFEMNQYVFADEYVDDGNSGTTDYERPNFKRLQNDIEKEKVNCVIVKDLARAFRNYSDQGYYLEQFFPKHNIRFITIGTPMIDSFLNPESMNSFDVPITGVMNDRYCKKTSDDIRRIFDMKRRKGEFIGAFAPYGYDKNPLDKNSLIVDDEAAQVVRDIFTWFVNDGFSKAGIAKKLNELAVSNPSSYKKKNGMKYQNPHASANDGLWSPSTITKILQSAVYIGTMVQGKQRIKSYKVHEVIIMPEDEWFVVPNTHEAIIDSNIFEKAQSLQIRDTRTAPDKKEIYLFSGFVRCADCDKAMTRKKSRNLVYYICRTYTDKSKSACSRHTIREDKLEKAVLKSIQIQVDLIENLTDIIDEINNAVVIRCQSTRIIHMIKMREQELQKTISVSDCLYMDWKSGDITKDEYKRLKSKYEEQAVHLKQALNTLRQENHIMENEIDADDPYLFNFLKYKNINSVNRGILVEIIDKIYVHKNGELTINFNFADQHRL